MVPCSLKDIWNTRPMGEKLSSEHKVTGRKAYHLFHKANLHLHPYYSYCCIFLLVLDIIPMNQNQPPTATGNRQIKTARQASE